MSKSTRLLVILCVVLNVASAVGATYVTYRNNRTYQILHSYYLNKYDEYCTCAFEASLEHIQTNLEIEQGNTYLQPWADFNKNKMDSCRKMAKKYENILNQLK